MGTVAVPARQARGHRVNVHRERRGSQARSSATPPRVKITGAGLKIAEMHRQRGISIETSRLEGVPGFEARPLHHLPRAPMMKPTLHAALRTARNILFVCLGNTCRSPAAEGFARHHARHHFDPSGFQRLRIESAGLSAFFKGAQPESIRFVKQLAGEDISGHRTRTITREDAASFDVIITMETYMNQRILAMFPGVDGLASKLFTLREACMDDAPGGSLDIEDPYMHDESTYLSIITEIEACTKALIEAWRVASMNGRGR